MIVTIRTDKPVSEIGLYDISGKQLYYHEWQAHRQLAETIHDQIAKIMQKSGIELKSVKGVVVYEGPGSFTGLRIGVSVANALAYSLNVPITASAGSNWQVTGIGEIQKTSPGKYAKPEYGSPAHVTKQKK